MTLPREIDLRHFDEATALLTALAECSRRLQLNFDVYYAGEVIGSVSGERWMRASAKGSLGMEASTRSIGLRLAESHSRDNIGSATR